MADATMLPTLFYGQWSRPDAPNPRLASPISSTQTTITVTNPLLDEDGSVVALAFLMGIRNTQGYVESVYVPAGGCSADGLTLTGCVRGVDLSGLDFTTGNASLASDFDQDSSVTCQISGVNFNMMLEAMRGTIASGGTSWKIGDGTDSHITVTAYNADTNKPYFRYDKTTNEWVYSNDGVSSTPFGTGAGLTAGDGIDITGGVVSAVLNANKGLEFSGGGIQNKVVAPITLSSSGIGWDATANLTLSGIIDLAGTWKVAGTTVTSDAGELNKLDGASANVTATNLNTLTGGTDASAMHSHKATNGVFENSTQSGAVTYAHGLGVTPTKILFEAYYGQTGKCAGSWTSAGNKCVYVPSSSVIAAYNDASNCLTFSDGSNHTHATVSSADATNFTITWGTHDNHDHWEILWTAFA